MARRRVGARCGCGFGAHLKKGKTSQVKTAANLVFIQQPSYAYLRLRLLSAAVAAMSLSFAQQQPPPDDHNPNSATAPSVDASADQPVSEKWNLFYQATSIGQYHGTFHSPYQGPNSLEDVAERDVSLTTTLFLGLRLDQNTQLYFNPEIAGGRGFSRVAELVISRTANCHGWQAQRQSPLWPGSIYLTISDLGTQRSTSTAMRINSRAIAR
jgi:hypothetical protein